MTLLVQCLMSSPGARGSVPTVRKSVMVAYILSAQEMGAEGSDIQGHPGLYFEASLGYLRLSQKKRERGHFWNQCCLLQEGLPRLYIPSPHFFFPKEERV